MPTTPTLEPTVLSKDDVDELRQMDNIVASTETKGALYELLKKRADLNLAGIVRDINIQCGQGGYSDVFIGTCMSKTGASYRVAVKKLRSHIMEDTKFQKRLAKELYIWSKLNHPRILPLEGFYIENDSYPYLVSKWMENGTIMKYLETHPDANLLSLVSGIAEGIDYLHSNDIVHSDIKPDNVLISDSNEPLLCDFGVSRLLILSETYSLSTAVTGGLRGTIRYMSKELLHATSDSEMSMVYSKESDVWALGMMIFALLTKRVPYHQIVNDAALILAICNGVLPTWPEDRNIWPLEHHVIGRICAFCWKEPKRRPSMHTIRMELDHLSSVPGHSSLRFDVTSYDFYYLRSEEDTHAMNVVTGTDPVGTFTPQEDATLKLQTTSQSTHPSLELRNTIQVSGKPLSSYITNATPSPDIQELIERVHQSVQALMEIADRKNIVDGVKERDSDNYKEGERQSKDTVLEELIASLKEPFRGFTSPSAQSSPPPSPTHSPVLPGISLTESGLGNYLLTSLSSEIRKGSTGSNYRQLLIRSLELAREAVILDSRHDIVGAIKAYDESVTLLDVVLQRIRAENSRELGEQKIIGTSDEISRLKGIRDTYRYRLDILRLSRTVPSL